MWDSNAPLQLLKTMPKKLTKENLEKIQLVLDADKYKNSLISGFDLCGMYAPFCRGCNKTSIFPCAIAYINMLKADGMDIEIYAKPVDTADKYASASYNGNVASGDNIVKSSLIGETAVTNSVHEEKSKSNSDVHKSEHENLVSEKKAVINPSVNVEHIKEQSIAPVKSKIRIAVARKKI